MCGTGMTISTCCHSLAKKKNPKEHPGAAALNSKAYVIILLSHLVKNQNVFAMKSFPLLSHLLLGSTLCTLPVPSFPRDTSYTRKLVWYWKRIAEKTPWASLGASSSRGSGEDGCAERLCGRQAVVFCQSRCTSSIPQTHINCRNMPQHWLSVCTELQTWWETSNMCSIHKQRKETALFQHAGEAEVERQKPAQHEQQCGETHQPQWMWSLELQLHSWASAD